MGKNKAKKMQSFFSKIREKKSPTKKGIKIAFISKPERKIGIAAESLQTLKQKVKLKFYEDFDCSNEVYLFLKDGTEIDDDGYFDSLENQAFLWASNSENFPLPNPAAAVKEKNYLD